MKEFTEERNDERKNPFCKDGKWYWYDETEQLSEPYDTEEDARVALRSYLDLSLGC
jgi:hypothetical protein